jgi:predicted ArsR family transcriptional regulator
LSTTRTEPGNGSTGWDAIHLLSEPTRRLIYDTVRRASAPLRRDDVAARTGVNRRLASFHLDRLADGGLLTVGFARPAGRAGPGAGRPAKHYSATPPDVTVTIPPRRYDLAARLLAEAIDTTTPGEDARSHAFEIARRQGRRIGELRAPAGPVDKERAVAVTVAALADLGYDPHCDGSDDVVRLRNCPFDAVVDVAPRLVCDVNVRLVGGLLDGLGADQLTARLVGPCDGCCVAVETAGATAGGSAADQASS